MINFFKEEKISFPGWDRTTNLSVNSRMRYRLRHGDSIFNSSKKSCEISIYYPFSKIISLNVKISKFSSLLIMNHIRFKKENY